MDSTQHGSADLNTRPLRSVVFLLCCLAGLVGVVDLAGWWMHHQVVSDVYAGFAVMKPNTALMMVVLCVAVWLRQTGGRWKVAANVLGWLVVALTAATLMEYLTGYNLGSHGGLDQMLAYAPPDAGGDPPGRMAAGTAVCALLAALGLLLLDVRAWLSGPLVGLSGLISLSALMGFLFDAGPLKGVPVLRSMAFGTAGCLFALAVATLLLRPGREPVNSLLYAMRTRGADFAFVAGTCLTPLGLGLPVAYLYRHRVIDATFSFALLIVLLMVLQAVLISRNTRSLARMEEKRSTVESARVALAEENERSHQESVRNAARAEESEELYRLISDAVPAYIAYLDRDLRYVRANRTYREWFGKTTEEIEGHTIEDVLGTSAADVRPYLEAALTGKTQHLETRFETVRGERMVSLTEIPDFDAQGKVRGVVVQGTDTTEIKRSEQMLRVKGERLRAAQKASEVAAWDCDLATLRVTWDEDSTLLYGRPLAEVETIGDILACVHPEDVDGVRAAMRAARAGQGEFNTEYRVVWPDESVHWILGRGRLFFDEAGQPLRVAGVNMDTTLRRQTEVALLQNEKLAAVGRLASTIAHELNNPLESVTNLIYLALQSAEGDEVKSFLRLAESELSRASAIASQTLKFHRQATRPTLVAPPELLEGVLGLQASRTMNAGVTVEMRARPGKPVLCFEGEMRQVLHNLIGNAIDAMPGGGRLLVRSRGVECGVVFTIADTGMGISAAALRKLFTPFFTTKGISGTGLGLWVSQGIVERHKGSLRVRSRVGAGTVFRIALPWGDGLR